ncbi:MAG: sialidase family protein [Verrucomicrobiota bacterium]
MKTTLTLLTALLLAPLAALQAADAPKPPASTKAPSVLWDSNVPMPKAAELPQVQGAEFHVIKRYDPKADGYRFLHGVALAWHKDKLYATFGHNQGAENTAGEAARGRVSSDGGRTWGDIFTIDDDKNDGLGISHGVLVSHQGTLWAFHCALYGKMERCHTRAYVLNERTGRWEKKGVILADGFGPNQSPHRMSNGNWIMAGRIRDPKAGNPAAVAISKGDDLTQWELVKIPKPAGLKMYGESSVIVEGKRIISIHRSQEKPPYAIAAVSEDYGRTWSTSLPSNLPMATSKPYAGTLSTGQRYLVCTTTADTGGKRSPLTIAVSKPGEEMFSKVFVIRHAKFPEGPGESHPQAALSYPYAIEHDGKLYVGYSNNGGNIGRVGTDNNNSAELAIIPVEKLKVTP